MRVALLIWCGSLFATGVSGQDSTARARADSAAADSVALVRELEAAAAAPARQGGGGAANPRLLPDLSAVGDLVSDFSRRGSTLEGGQRFAVREIEVAIQAAVDPYFRGDIFLGFNDEEGAAVEQAYLTTASLPWRLEGRLGRFLMPFGKQNTTHRHDLHTIEYPYVLQRFLGAEGLKGTGFYLSRVFAPLGFYQELQAVVTDRLGEDGPSLVTAEPVNTKLAGLGYTARLRNYLDLTKHANVEVSGTVATGRRAQPVAGLGDITATAVRQTLVGIDVTFRWRPLQQGLYRSFILQSEIIRQVNGRFDPAGGGSYLGPTRNYTGGYLFGRYQLTRRGYVGARIDRMSDPENGGDRLTAVSGYYQFFPSEFSKLLAGFERVSPGSGPAYGRILLQATFALGPHKPHPF